MPTVAGCGLGAWLMRVGGETVVTPTVESPLVDQPSDFDRIEERVTVRRVPRFPDLLSLGVAVRTEGEFQRPDGIGDAALPL